MLYFRYKKFVKIFKIVKKANNIEHIEWKLEEKYGNDAKDAISILRAEGAVGYVGLYHECVNSVKMDTLILEYEAKCSSIFWGCVKWMIGTTLTVMGLLIAYSSLSK